MKNIILKIALLSFVSFFIFSCTDEYDNVSPLEENTDLVLLSPAVSTVTLTDILANENAFNLAWNDNTGTTGDYQVVMSTDESFDTEVVLGTTSNHAFAMTIGELNSALLNAGFQPYTNQMMYVRVKKSSEYSNAQSFTVNPYPIDGPTIVSPEEGTALVLMEETSQEEITMTWEDYMYGEDVTYKIYAAVAGTDFADAILVATVENEMSITWTQHQVNRVAQNLGLVPEEPQDISFRIEAITESVTGEIIHWSNTRTITVTPYSTVLDLSTTWGVVGSGTPNGWDGPDVPFYRTSVDGVLVAYAQLVPGEIKFRENNDWANNYGDDGFDGTLEPNGSNIPITEAGSYKITMDLNNLTYTMEMFSLGIVGSAAPNGWDGPDVMMHYDPYSDQFRVITALADGEMKFRMNNDWAVNYGDDGADGTLEMNGSNIAVSAGTYIVTVNLNEMTYSLEAIDNVWGIIGSATPNGWDSDVDMTRDWSVPNDDVWIIENITLVDGEMKFRANDNWDLNYGDDNADGTIEQNGSNIAVSAGTYTIRLDLTNMVWSME